MDPIIDIDILEPKPNYLLLLREIAKDLGVEDNEITLAIGASSFQNINFNITYVDIDDISSLEEECLRS